MYNFFMGVDNFLRGGGKMSNFGMTKCVTNSSTWHICQIENAHKPVDSAEYAVLVSHSVATSC